MSKFILKGRVINSIDDEEIEDGIVVINDNLIEYVGKQVDANYDNLEVIEIKDGTIMPGFIDCHSHFSELGDDGLNDNHFNTLLNIASSVGNLLDCGFTSVREMSVFGASIGKAVEDGIVRGPRVVPGGRLLGITGGHSDIGLNLLPKEVYNRISTLGYLVDGVPECVQGVRIQFKEGAKFIKISATGGVSSKNDGLNDVQFSADELEAIVNEAKNHGTYVAAHCSNKEGVLHALKAGVTSIEHCIDLDDECIDLMKKLDATVVATLTVSVMVSKMENIPKWMSNKAKQAAKTHVAALKRIKAEGIRIAYGLDFTKGDEGVFTNSGKEFETLVKELGLTPMESIKVGTINSAHLLNMENQIGTLEKGKIADIVIVNGNPLEDIRILQKKDNIKVVFQDGKIVKKIS